MLGTPRKKRKLEEGIQQWGGSSVTFNISSADRQSQTPLSPRRLRPFLRSPRSQRHRVVAVPSTSPPTFFSLGGLIPTPTSLATPPVPPLPLSDASHSQATTTLHSLSLAPPPISSLSFIVPSQAAARTCETRGFRSLPTLTLIRLRP